MLGAALQAGAQNVPMLFVGRLILGGGIGLANQARSPFACQHDAQRSRALLLAAATC